MFTTKDVAEYYNTTQVHYEQWWNLKKNLSLHYGIWENGVNSFSESLENTNRVMMELSQISASDKVLDAGCGVGGAAMFLAERKNVEVVGITLSEKQQKFATQAAKEKKLDNTVSFQLMDYTNTEFEDESFDVVWACESMTSSPDKSLFIKEAFRVLKKGGRLILSDFFQTKVNQPDPKSLMKKWGATWGISNFPTSEFLRENLESNGFQTIQSFDYTEKINKSAKRMYYTAILGMIPSEIYNFFNPKVSRFAKTHYQCGYFQYKALKSNLWRYNIFVAKKPEKTL